jgi:hypothetical protein
METQQTQPQTEAIAPHVLIRENLDIYRYEMVLDTSNPTTQNRSGQRFVVSVHLTKFSGGRKEQLVFLFKEMARLIEEGWE